MEFTDLQLILVGVVLTAVALVVLFDHLGKQIPRRHVAPANPWSALLPQVSLHGNNLQFLPMREPPVNRVLEPQEAIAILSEPPAPRAIARETVTIQVTAFTDLSVGSSDAEPSTQQTSSLPAFTIDAELWDRLIASMPQHDLLTAREQSPSPKPASDEPASTVLSEIDSEWPCGMIRQPELQRLLDAGEPFSGLVVSIGINDLDSSMWHSQTLIHSVGDHIAGLLQGQEFACRLAFDEFVLVCRDQTGGKAQRRLNHLSEQLWHYQLRDAGSGSVLLSWDGVQVYDEALGEAIASAVDRMRQNRRFSTTVPALARAQSVAV